LILSSYERGRAMDNLEKELREVYKGLEKDKEKILLEMDREWFRKHGGDYERWEEKVELNRRDYLEKICLNVLQDRKRERKRNHDILFDKWTKRIFFLIIGFLLAIIVLYNSF
jgi:hypothetical protein